MNESYFRHAGKLMELFKEFKSDKKPKETLSTEEYQRKIDAILDQISFEGKDSLKPDQKEFLENHVKSNSEHRNSSEL